MSWQYGQIRISIDDLQIARKDSVTGKMQLMFYEGVHAEHIWRDCEIMEMTELTLAEPFLSLSKSMDDAERNEMIGELLAIKAPHTNAAIAAVITSTDVYNTQIQALASKYTRLRV